MKVIRAFEAPCPRCGRTVRVDWVSLEGRCEACGLEFVDGLPEEVELAVQMFNKAMVTFRKWGKHPEDGVLRQEDLSARIKKALGGE